MYFLAALATESGDGKLPTYRPCLETIQLESMVSTLFGVTSHVIFFAEPRNCVSFLFWPSSPRRTQYRAAKKYNTACFVGHVLVQYSTGAATHFRETLKLSIPIQFHLEDALGPQSPVAGRLGALLADARMPPLPVLRKSHYERFSTCHRGCGHLPCPCPCLARSASFDLHVDCSVSAATTVRWIVDNVASLGEVAIRYHIAPWLACQKDVIEGKGIWDMTWQTRQERERPRQTRSAVRVG